MTKKDNNEFDPRTAIYTPAQTASYGLQAVKRSYDAAEAGVGIGIPIAEIRDYFPPVLPGQICAVIGQTSNFKSGFLHFVEHDAAWRLNEKGNRNDIIIHVSVEEIIEEQAFLEFSRESGEYAGDLARGEVQNWDKLQEVAIRIGDIPIYRIGESLARAEDMPKLYMSNMIRAIRTLVEGDILDWKPNVAGIFFDYLQAFPIDPETRHSVLNEQRRLQVRSDIYRLRQCAAYFQCPVYVAVQAKQELRGASPPIMLPGIYDGEETSSIGQRFDRVVTLWMPKMTYPVGYFVEKSGMSFIVEENQLWVKVAKQRGRLPSGKVWPCLIDYQSNVIAPDASMSIL